MIHLTQRKATINDLPFIVQLLSEDELGQTREIYTTDINTCYQTAFEKINIDPNQYLMVICTNEKVIGTCHLTLMPSLTYQGSMRMQIEAVRIAKNYRGQKLGEWMMQQAFDYAKQHDVKMIQLTTNKLRPRAKQFYEHLGFQASHEGMKYFLDDHNVE